MTLELKFQGQIYLCPPKLGMGIYSFWCGSRRRYSFRFHFRALSSEPVDGILTKLADALLGDRGNLLDFVTLTLFSQ